MGKVYLLLGIISMAVVLVASVGTQVSGHAAEARTVSSDTLHRPLRFLMVGLGQDMSRISDGIWHEDYGMIRVHFEMG